VQVYGNVQLEVAWTVIPALLVASILVLSLQVMPEIYSVPGESVASAADIGVCYVGNLTTDQAVAAAGSDLLVVKVVGKQWFWEFEYPQYGFRTATQLVAPAGRVVKLDLTAADVMHAWWIPELGPQFNVTPGYSMTSWFNAEKPRVYEGQCSMFCGDAHPYMPMQVVALPASEFDQWAEAQRLPRAEPATALATQGEALFAARGCIGCHAINGYPENKAVAQVGPNLTHFGSRTRVAAFLESTPQNISRWLRNPQEVKPGAKMPNLNLQPDEIAALTAYLQSLK
jgi:cytochrome c oxidase subunit 2